MHLDNMKNPCNGFFCYSKLFAIQDLNDKQDASVYYVIKIIVWLLVEGAASDSSFAGKDPPSFKVGTTGHSYGYA